MYLLATLIVPAALALVVWWAERRVRRATGRMERLVARRQGAELERYWSEQHRRATREGDTELELRAALMLCRVVQVRQAMEGETWDRTSRISASTGTAKPRPD